MAVGNATQGLSSVASGAYLSIQPTGTDEWLIHNIYASGDVEVYFYNGTTRILVEKIPEGKTITNRRFHCTNTKYYQVKNVDSASKNVAYDGVQTK